MPKQPVLIDVDLSNVDSLPCCGIKNPMHRGVIAKRRWLKAHLKLGLKAKILIDDDGKPCGYIESIPVSMRGETSTRAATSSSTASGITRNATGTRAGEARWSGPAFATPKPRG